MTGYIKLHRRWHQSPTFEEKEYCERAAWVWLLSNAAWKDTVRRTGQGGIIEIKRGQLHVSLASLASAWGWSIKRVRGFIKRLEIGHSLDTVKGTTGTVITICNYGKYQDNMATEGTGEGTAKGTVGAQSGHTQEESKEYKEEKNNIPAGPVEYAFCGQVVRLKPDAFANWQKNFPDLDLAAALQSRDDWLSTEADDAAKRRWFISTSNWLASKQREARAERGVAKVPL